MSIKNKKVQPDNKIATRLFWAVKIGFGIVWAIDAAFKFEPTFYRGITTFVKAKDTGEPSWLNPWYHTWFNIIGAHQGLIAVILIALEVSIALSLLFGIARKTVYIGGTIFSFLIWGVGEAFGGPYVPGSTDLNAGIIYALLFICLYALDSLVKPERFCLDKTISKYVSWWPNVKDPKFRTLFSTNSQLLAEPAEQGIALVPSSGPNGYGSGCKRRVANGWLRSTGQCL